MAESSGFLPFGTPHERVVSIAALIGIGLCSFLFGIVGGLIAFGVYGLGLKLHERRQLPHR